jgi:cobalt-zinc-cadmium resistance protein CzcA
MLRRLVERALQLRLSVLGLAAILALIGGWSFANLPIDAFPDISSTQVKIILKAPGMTPEEVESRVITPIEMESEYYREINTRQQPLPGELALH